MIFSSYSITRKVEEKPLITLTPVRCRIRRKTTILYSLSLHLLPFSICNGRARQTNVTQSNKSIKWILDQKDSQEREKS